MNVGFRAEFAFDGVVAAVGRRVGTDVVPEPGFDQRVENGVVLFVKAADRELRSCVLDTLRYDAGQDEQDERRPDDQFRRLLRELCSLGHYSDVSLPESLLIGGMLAIPLGIFAAGFVIGRYVRRPKD